MLKRADRVKRFFLAAVAVLVLSASAGRPPVAKPADIAGLLEADQAFDRATATKGLEGFASFIADDVSTLRPDKPVITGKSAMVDLWTPLLHNPALSIRWKPLSASASTGGDLGYTVGSYEITQTDDKGKTVAATGKYVTIWRKQADGSWKVVFDSGVADTAPTGDPGKPAN
jgi:ketosteroid isomerase-like protein